MNVYSNTNKQKLNKKQQNKTNNSNNNTIISNFILMSVKFIFRAVNKTLMRKEMTYGFVGNK